MDLKEQPQLRHVKGLGVDVVDWTYKDLRISNPQIGLHSSHKMHCIPCVVLPNSPQSSNITNASVLKTSYSHLFRRFCAFRASKGR